MRQRIWTAIACASVVVGLWSLPIANAAIGRVFYASPRGKISNPGSKAEPFVSISSALKTLKAGDTLVLRGGDYNENVNATVHSGTATSPVIVKAAPGERPLIHGSLYVSNASYYTFDGINVVGVSGTNKSAWMIHIPSSSHWRYTNSELYGAHSTAILGASSTDDNYRIDHNFIHDTYKSNGTNQDHNIYVQSPITANGLIDHNIIANSLNGRGIKIGQDPVGGYNPPVGGVTVQYNTIYNNAGPANIQLSYGATNVVIDHNILDKPAAGYDNITLYNATGNNNVAHDNIGWDSKGVMDKGPALKDGGGNKMLNPQFDNTTTSFHPLNPAAQAYGRYAG